MAYKRKLLLLSLITGLLALGYGVSLVFSPGRLSVRDARYVWLDPKWLDQVDRIDIRGGEDITLTRKQAEWFVITGEREFPARQSRVQDLLETLSVRGDYPLRGESPSSHERLGLGENAAHRLTLRGGAGTPLLDLLIGNQDAEGQVYLRKTGLNEVRSGEDSFSPYVQGSRSAWYNLKIFGAEETPGADQIQRVRINAPAGGEGASLILTRSGQGWTMEAPSPNTGMPENSLVDGYVRALLDAEGDDFITTLDVGDPVFDQGSITMELGNGAVRVIRLGPVIESGGEEGPTQTRRSAVVTGSPYVYALAEWTINRLFRDAAYFAPQ
jgi:hypothetical protein